MKYQAKINLTNKNNSHTLTFDRISDHAAGRKLRVLEAGCSSGYFGSALVEHGHEVWGVEPYAEAATKAREVLHKVHTGFIEEFFSLHQDARFDVIVFGDVLEHLTDPINVLIKSSEFLTEDGVIVASVPNVAHLAIRAMMLEGRWDYSDLGILDRTHLKFFTRNTLIDLFSNAGYKVLSVDPVRLSAEQVDEICHLNLQATSIKAAKDFAFDTRGYDFQYVVSAVPGNKFDQVQAHNTALKHSAGIRVLCLVHDPASSIVEIRLRNPLKRWASTFGGNIKIASLYESNREDLNWADVVIFQRDANKYVAGLTSNLQSSGKKVVFEIDDLLTELPPFLGHHLKAMEASLPYIKQILLQADALSVSSDALANGLRLEGEHVFVTPNYSESITLTASHHQVSARDVRLIVASSDKVLVDMLIEPLLILQRELGVQVIGIGPPGERLAAAGIHVEKYPNFGHAEFKSFIASIDNGIGLIPLDTSNFSSCKTAVKYFDYSVCGVPSICSNVIPYAPIIEHGITGLLSENTTESWITCLRKLIDSHDLRIQMVNSARESVALCHNIDLSARSWQRLFDSLEITPGHGNGAQLYLGGSHKSYAAITKLALKHMFKLSSYYKAARTLSKHGIKGLYERVSRR